MHNFSAGPCVLPREVYQKAAEAVLDYEGSGLSILEISHRSDAFLSILAEARALALDLLHLDKSEYQTLFLQGSASMEFLRVPYNLLQAQAGYIDTGTWSSKAIAQAELLGQTQIVGSSKADGYRSIPKSLIKTEELDYLHFTSNNTIYGTQFKSIPSVDAPLVCDMSSDIYSRTFEYDKIDLIYAGLQKNIGPAGMSMVLVRESVLGKVDRVIPNMLDYNAHIHANNLYHTANVFGVYTSLLNFKWLQKQGGVEGIEKHIPQQNPNDLKYRKAKLLSLHSASKEFRSAMNVAFHFKDPSVNVLFDRLCEEASIVNIKGHRTLGGYRASLYNALEMKSVEVLVSTLQRLEALV